MKGQERLRGAGVPERKRSRDGREGEDEMAATSSDGCRLSLSSGCSLASRDEDTSVCRVCVMAHLHGHRPFHICRHECGEGARRFSLFWHDFLPVNQKKKKKKKGRVRRSSCSGLWGLACVRVLVSETRKERRRLSLVGLCFRDWFLQQQPWVVGVGGAWGYR